MHLFHAALVSFAERREIIMNKSNAKPIEENPRCKKYVLQMKDYSMSDINLYNYISFFFMPEVSYS